MNIGIIGAGAIATFVLGEVQKEKDLNVTSIFVRNYEKYQHLEDDQVSIYTDFDKFIASDIDIVVEAAGVEAAKEWLPRLVSEKDTIVISIGALANEEFIAQLHDTLKTSNKNLYLPSGAIAGLDFIQNIKAAGLLKEVSLETRKPAHTLTDDPLTEEKVVFDGLAAEAIKQYPKNVNVSIALALAGIGLQETKMTLVADPHVTENEHTIHVMGETGTATFKVANKPLPTNPNSSYQAAVSILGTLKKINANIKIG